MPGIHVRLRDLVELQELPRPPLLQVNRVQALYYRRFPCNIDTCGYIQAIPEAIPLEVLNEDEHLMVINKVGHEELLMTR